MPITEKAIALARDYLATRGRPVDRVKVTRDTTDFFKVEYSDVLLLDIGAYLILGHEREGRFGLDDQVKHWVKKAVDLETDRRKVIKLAFFESFDMRIGEITYQCFRSPRKEARILDLVRGRPNFMQGMSTEDPEGNNVRIIDYITGPTLAEVVENLDQPHEEYVALTLPRLLDELFPALEGLDFLHQNMEKHGDVRRDHLIYSGEKRLVWIDFDYNYRHGEYIAGLDLAGVGNILAFLVGQGDQTLPVIKRERPDVFDRLRQEDMSLVFDNRLMNLKKLFPYLPGGLNRVLHRFSAGSDVFYDSVSELLADLREAREDLS